ncbi:MAG: RagB/SusD family nutrient uptake outer membrane protein [Paludibacteraceae bacterium]|nr:RagB/SusD family nutrient uptake outer membrane protein [Paludibacteraceae bacterium]
MKQFKLIPLAVLASLTMSSCDDLLEKDSMDTVTIDQYLTSDANLRAYTYSSLYGPYSWTNYEAKFSWCANELTVGNVYHNYSDEGSFFFLNFGAANAHLLNGFEALYGVISRCNMIINNLESQCSDGVSADAIKKAKGEAYLFRGLCYFLLTEYWGETYIVTNNENVITSDNTFSVPKSDRACLYAQAEKDFAAASTLLPAEKWGDFKERPSSKAAYGMLAKLYLTMGAASTNDPTGAAAAHPFYADKTYAEYNTMAYQYATMALEGAYLEMNDYENLFWPKQYNQENLFSLYFEDGPYGAGSCRQQNFARSCYMTQAEDYYGGEKGLTVNLFKSFEAGDIRKKACCYYTDQATDMPATGSLDPSNPTKGRTPVYKMYQDNDYVYYYNPSKTFADKKGNVISPYGSEPLSPCLNACRKFVYGVHLQNKFSAPLSFAWLRTADLYLMRAEAAMALATAPAEVSTPTTAGLADINVIRKRAGLTPYTQPIALYNTDPAVPTQVTYSGDDGKTFPSYTTYSDTYDLLEERRHEFALECQNWLDLKRIYYRNSFAGNEFLEHEDRAATYAQAYGVEDYVKGISDLQRNKEINMIDPSQPAETELDYSNVAWFFPIPAKIQNSGSNQAINHDVASIKNGTYSY